MNDFSQRLLDIKQQVQEAQTKKDQAEGALENIMQGLQKKHKVKTIAQAKKKLKAEQAKAEKLEEEIEGKLDEIEEKLEGTV